ncbi:OmpA family protein [Sulfitobacter sp. LCG007]
MILRAAVPGLLLAASSAVALDLPLPPGANQTVDRPSVHDVYSAPSGGFADGAVPALRIEGAVDRKAWRIATPGLTPLQIIDPMRSALVAAGYDVILDCTSRECGGFDFRFAIEVLPGPNMYVNLRDYHALTAIRGTLENPSEAITLLASSADGSSYLQMIDARNGAAPAPEAAAGAPSTGTPSAGPAAQPVTVPSGEDFDDRLMREGYAVLDDLDFPSGKAALGRGPFASLAALASLMGRSPGLRVALVGHTDSTGSLGVNVEVSRDRARAVRDRLVSEHGADPSRLEAEGMGYLAPRGSNLTPQGREANRRVEAVLLSQ